MPDVRQREEYLMFYVANGFQVLSTVQSIACLGARHHQDPAS